MFKFIQLRRHTKQSCGGINAVNWELWSWFWIHSSSQQKEGTHNTHSIISQQWYNSYNIISILSSYEHMYLLPIAYWSLETSEDTRIWFTFIIHSTYSWITFTNTSTNQTNKRWLVQNVLTLTHMYDMRQKLIRLIRHESWSHEWPCSSSNWSQSRQCRAVSLTKTTKPSRPDS